MTAADAGRMLGLNSQTVVKLFEIESYKDGREWRIPAHLVRAYQESRYKKLCPWCGRPAKGGPVHVTCGGPICTKRQRQSHTAKKVKAKPKARTREQALMVAARPDGFSRKRISDLVRMRLSAGFGETQAIVLTAKEVGEPVAVVMSVMNAVGR